MLQYIINLTSIWLVSLIVFDLFFKRDTYHRYNRFFLNASLVLGVFLPLWSWQQEAILFGTDTTKQVVTQASAIKEQVVSSSTPFVLSWQTWLLAIYVLGALIMFSFLFRELLTIISLLKKGTKTKYGKLTIIETNKHISPFSAFGYIFISRLTEYNDEELSIILAHEKKHLQLLHVVDLLFININKVVFWFIPLVYLFEKRLLLVHEYQADASIKEDKSNYGKFLVEQSILKSAPVLSHSFIRSPLKARIKMLNRTSKKIAHFKQLIIAPLVLFVMLCFTQSSLLFAQEKKVDGNKITYKGNTIELAEVLPDDTVYVQDPVTGEVQMVISSKEPDPIKLNGIAIYNKSYWSREQPVAIKQTINHLTTEISDDIGKELEELEEGSFKYHIDRIIINKEGKIAYYELSEINKAFSFDDSKEYPLPKDVAESITQKIVAILDNIEVETFTEKGKKSPYMIQIEDYFNIVK